MDGAAPRGFGQGLIALGYSLCLYDRKMAREAEGAVQGLSDAGASMELTWPGLSDSGRGTSRSGLRSCGNGVPRRAGRSWTLPIRLYSMALARMCRRDGCRGLPVSSVMVGEGLARDGGIAWLRERGRCFKGVGGRMLT